MNRKILGVRGAWVAQSVKRLTSAQVMILRFMGLSSDSSEPEACFRFCVSLSLTLPRSHSVSLSKINILKILEKYLV